MECQPKGFDLQGFGHLRGGAQLENFQKGQFSRNLPTSAVNGESWIFRENAQFLSFWQDGRVLDSFFLLALFWEIVIQNVDTPTCREKTPQWSPNGQPKGPTWIWEATDLVKSYSNHIISYHITSYHIISHHIISYHISYIISNHPFLGGVNDDGAHIYKDEPYWGEKQRWLLCFSEPKRSLLQWWKLATATWAVTKTLVIAVYTGHYHTTQLYKDYE